VTAYVLRRIVSAIPALLVFAIGLFVAIAIVPPGRDAPADDQARRFWHLPLLVNLAPDDRPRLVARIVARLPGEVGERRDRDIGRLSKIGAAGLPDLVTALAELEPRARGQIARELAPLAFRMGLEDVRDLEEPARAEGFWARILDERGADLRPASVRRALARHLADRAEPLYARQLRTADTAVLAPIFEELESVRSPSTRGELEGIAIAALQRTGEGGVHDSATLRAYWAVHHADYVEFGTLERLAGRLTETRFGRWVIQAVTHRFGVSWRTGEPVAEDLGRRAPTTVSRALLALALAYALAVPIALVTAARRFGPADRAASTVLLVLHAFPAFLLALVARAASPRLARTDAFLIVALAVVALAPIARHLRSRLLEEVHLDYVRAARSLGVEPLRLWTRTIARNVAGPAAALAAAEVPLVLAATLLAEEILALDGLGPAVIAAVRMRDVPWLMAFALMAAVFGAAALIAGDVVQAILDPRVRHRLATTVAEDA
jgi:peptide/nickel transport system permease protein